MSTFSPDEGGSLLAACPCLPEFISTVVHNTASDPGVLSFTLKLTGLMAATEDGFKLLQVELLTPCTFTELLVTMSDCGDVPPCRNAPFWTWPLTFVTGKRQGSGRILVYGLAGSRA